MFCKMSGGEVTHITEKQGSSFSRLLKEQRAKLGLIQAEVAKLLGITTSSYCNKENGITPFNHRELIDLIEVLNIPLPVILERIRDKER